MSYIAQRPKMKKTTWATQTARHTDKLVGQMKIPEQYAKNCAKHNKHAEPYAEIWTAQSNEAKVENIMIMRCTMLAPLLFGTQTYCSDALREAISGKLLPENGLWPIFYEEEKQKQLESFTLVVEYALRALESDPFFITFTLTDYGMNKAEADTSCIGYFQYLCKDLKETIPMPDLLVYIRIIRMQLKHIIEAMLRDGVDHLVRSFRSRQAAHQEASETIKEKGNHHTREGCYRAAIADYTRAIKLSPYNEVLYCNRAMFSLRCKDYWLACIDGQRAYVLKPDYEKAYYRCAESLIEMGRMRYAAIVSQTAGKVCDVGMDTVRLWEEIKDQWNKAELGHKDLRYDFSKADLERGLPRVFVDPELPCAECVGQARRLGALYHGMPKPVLFKAPYNPHAEEMAAMKELMKKSGGTLPPDHPALISNDPKHHPPTAASHVEAGKKGYELRTKLSKKQRAKMAKRDQQQQDKSLALKEGSSLNRPMNPEAIAQALQYIYEDKMRTGNGMDARFDPSFGSDFGKVYMDARKPGA